MSQNVLFVSSSFHAKWVWAAQLRQLLLIIRYFTLSRFRFLAVSIFCSILPFRTWSKRSPQELVRIICPYSFFLFAFLPGSDAPPNYGPVYFCQAALKIIYTYIYICIFLYIHIYVYSLMCLFIYIFCWSTWRCRVADASPLRRATRSRTNESQEC